MTARTRGASAVLFGLPGQEGFENTKELARSVSFKLTAVDESQAKPRT